MALLSIKQYTGDGGTTDFLYDFPYIKDADVHGYVDNVEVSISFVDPTHVRFAVAPANGTAVEIRRDSDSTLARHTFPDPSYIRSTHLNNNNEQLRYIEQEIQDVINAYPPAYQSAVDSASSAADSAASAASAAASYDSFDDRYLGVKASDPATDNDGDPLIEGAFYWRSTSPKLFRVYNGSTWVDSTFVPGTAGAIATVDAGGHYVTNNVEDNLQEVVEGGILQYTSLSVALKNALHNDDNLLINGNFDIWERGSSFSPGATATYTADRWACTRDGSGATVAVAPINHTVGEAIVPFAKKYFRFYQSVAGTGGTYNAVYQRIEGVHKFSVKTVTLSFYAKSGSANKIISIIAQQNFGTGGSPSSPVSTYIHNSDIVLTTGWQRYSYTVTLPSTVGKTMGTNNDDFLGIIIYFPPNVTQSIDLAAIKFEEGATATDFKYRTYADELALCQRYFEKGVTSSHFTNVASAATADYISQYFQVRKRKNPTLVVSNIGNVLGDGTLTTATGDTGHFLSVMSSGRTTTGNSRCTFDWTADAEL